MAQQSNVKKPNYNRHFPRSFMLNYGAALQDLSDQKILSRLKDFNCEWLSRPNIAISEMAQTIKDNWPLIEKQSGKVFTRKFVQDLGNVVLPLMDTYARLDNKDNSTHDPPTHDDVLDALEVVNINPDVEQLMVTAFNAAGPVLMTSIQMLAVNALLHNVSNFASKEESKTGADYHSDDSGGSRLTASRGRRDRQTAQEETQETPPSGATGRGGRRSGAGKPTQKTKKEKKQREREVHGGLARRFGERPGSTV